MSMQISSVRTIGGSFIFAVIPFHIQVANSQPNRMRVVTKARTIMRVNIFIVHSPRLRTSKVPVTTKKTCHQHRRESKFSQERIRQLFVLSLSGMIKEYHKTEESANWSLSPINLRSLSPQKGLLEPVTNQSGTSSGACHHKLSSYKLIFSLVQSIKIQFSFQTSVNVNDPFLGGNHRPDNPRHIFHYFLPFAIHVQFVIKQTCLSC